MIKAIFLVCKRNDLTFEQFRDYWIEVHGPIARRIPGVRKYVINLRLPDADEATADYDGISELWFDSLEAYRAGLAAPEGRASDADGVNFMDSARERLLLTDETEVV